MMLGWSSMETGSSCPAAPGKALLFSWGIGVER